MGPEQQNGGISHQMASCHTLADTWILTILPLCYIRYITRLIKWGGGGAGRGGRDRTEEGMGADGGEGRRGGREGGRECRGRREEEEEERRVKFLLDCKRKQQRRLIKAGAIRIAILR